MCVCPPRINVFADILNLTVKTELTADRQFGKVLENGTWTGCVGMVHRGDADVCTMGLSWTIVRDEAIGGHAHM